MYVCMYVCIKPHPIFNSNSLTQYLLYIIFTSEHIITMAAKFLQCPGCGGDHSKWTGQSYKYCLLASVEDDDHDDNRISTCNSSLSKIICFRRRKSTSRPHHPCKRQSSFTAKQEELVIKLHRQFGNRWSLIARELPGKKGEDIRNVCRRKHMKRKLQLINEQEAIAFVNDDDEEKGTDQVINNIDLNELPTSSSSSEEYMEDFFGYWKKNPLSFDLNQIPDREVEVLMI
ncbi:hypothetical protein ACOSQ3_023038 [Xanthoceras sorbifolium]